MFENKAIEFKGMDCKVYYSRIIASWYNAGGRKIRWHGAFRNWLNALEIPEDDIKAILELATNGKLELQDSAEKFIAENGKI